MRMTVQALYDFQAANDSEISFKANSIISVSDIDPTGLWYKGK